MSSDPSATGEVVVVRELDAPPEVAWRAWSDRELVRQWWGPTGFSCPRADVDFRVGGTTLVTMQAPAEYGGFAVHNRWTYTALAEPNRIEFVSTFSDADGNPIDPQLPASRPGCPPRFRTSSRSSRYPEGASGSPSRSSATPTTNPASSPSWARSSAWTRCRPCSGLRRLDHGDPPPR